jgi:aspartate 1-decarboxylase
MLRSKLHRAAITDADVDYEGSIGIDEALLEAADIIPNEQVHVYDISNGSRFVTYAIREPRGSRKIVINGAAARLVSVGDLIIIAAYGSFSEEEARKWEPRVILLGPGNVPKA